MHPAQILSCCLHEFPTGVIIISNLPSETKPGICINQVTFINNYARKIFHISQTEKESEIISPFKNELETFHKREFDKLTNISLYDVVFGGEEIKESGDSFFSESSMIFVKRKYFLDYILISVDDLLNEREDIRKKLLKSISYQHLNTLHHELNNPLNGLINTVEQIQSPLTDKVTLSVFLIKTVIKKFILYSKNMFDEILIDNTCISLFNLEFIFEKMAKKFLVAYDYKHIKVNIDECFSYLKNINIRSEQYYLKEFVRNIFLYLYYEIPKRSALKVKYDFVEPSNLLSMSFKFVNDRNSYCVRDSDNHLIDLSAHCNVEITNRVKTIEISKEILLRIAKMLNCSISFPEKTDIVFVVEFSEVYKGNNYDDDDSSDCSVNEFCLGTKNITEVPKFNEMTTFSYLTPTIKGIGKNSSKIVTFLNLPDTSNNTTNNNNTTNKNNEPPKFLGENLGIKHTNNESLSFQRTATLDTRKLVPSNFRFSGGDRDNSGINKKKNDLVYKRTPTLHSVVKICEKMRDPIIDNLKPAIVTSYLHDNKVISPSMNPKYMSSIFKKTLTTFTKMNDGDDKEDNNNSEFKNPFKFQPSFQAKNQMITTNQTNNSQSSCYNNTHNNSNSNIVLGRNNSHSNNNPKVIAPTSPDLFPHFKTKRFSSNVVLQITPSIRSELNGLNNNLAKIKNDLVELNGQNSSAYVDSRSPQTKSLNLSANLDDNKPDILLVDDEEFNLSSLQSLLKIEKLIVDTACNGEDAIRLIQENPSFKLIFMDVYMPIMDGIQACKIIQEMYQQGQVNQKVSVIIVSAHSKETIIHQIEKLTVVKKFCQKPLNRKKLKSILQEYYYS